MHTFDASSMIWAWDNYPISIFPPLWDWMAERFKSGEFSLSETAFNECYKSADCQDWLKKNKAKIHKNTLAMAAHSTQIHSLLGIVDNKYGNGVKENDIRIIASAKELSLILVSNEGIQDDVFRLPKNSKIPAVCKMKEVKVKCIRFLDLLNTCKPDLTNYEAKTKPKPRKKAAAKASTNPEWEKLFSEETDNGPEVGTAKLVSSETSGAVELPRANHEIQNTA
ncbi:MAG: DUF4411 family protein [Proteobacteria bacterium]|nr:MAG: DUF4411 family protein [Pseudomonadota bacterium]